MTDTLAFDSPPYAQRLAGVRDSLPAAGVDALLVTHPPNLRYLVGFDGSMGALLVSAETDVLVVDGRYLTTARARTQACPDLRHIDVQLADRSLEEAVASAVLQARQVRCLGVEAASITLSRFDQLSEELGRAEAAAAELTAPRMKATEGIVERGRLVKDVVEVEILREAGRRLSVVAGQVLGDLALPGRTERQIAAAIDGALRGGGFDRPAFDTIVASGPNSALPHARPTDRVVGEDDWLLLDFGGIYDGYCVDLTRTVQLGRPGVDFRRMFDAVAAAQRAAIEAVRPGVLASTIDTAARQVLDQCGFKDAFVHGTGHGLGLEIHEAPRVTKVGSSATDEVLKPGMVFTIEPGAYVPGLGGVRIEDDVLVVDTGCEILTDVPIDGTSGVR